MNPFLTFNKVLKLYIKSNIIPDLYKRWNETHRYYHTINHLIAVLQEIEKNSRFNELTIYEKHALLLSSFFHDIVYDPKRKDNEDQSIKYFLSVFKNNDPKMINVVCSLIECTKHRKQPTDKLQKILWDADNAGLKKGYNELLKYEMLIRKEYLHVSNKDYKEERIKFLNSCKGLFNKSVDKDLDKLISFVEKSY